MTPPSVEITDLRLRYQDTVALDGVRLHLDGGKIYGLLGRNGSGKTSLLSLLAAFLKPTSGSVLVDGEPVFENSRVMSRVCLIRESGDVGDPSDRVRDVLETAAVLRSGWDRGYATHLVERFGLPTGKKVSELSRGQRSALGVTVGLASRAPLTMFDESHLGMDAPSRVVFQEELLADFMERPRTVILSTHLVEEMSSLFEEVVILAGGGVLLHEETDTLRSRGAAVTGPAELVDEFVTGLTVLAERRLGRTKSATVYGRLDDLHHRQARLAGLDMEPIALQDLFSHLTDTARES